MLKTILIAVIQIIALIGIKDKDISMATVCILSGISIHSVKEKKDDK